jgi:hypothetical protein
MERDGAALQIQVFIGTTSTIIKFQAKKEV